MDIIQEIRGIIKIFLTAVSLLIIVVLSIDINAISFFNFFYYILLVTIQYIPDF